MMILQRNSSFYHVKLKAQCLDVGDIVGEMQTAAVIGTVAILRKVLDGGDKDRKGTVT